ncbi:MULTISPECIES: GNAT family N-acetyltransferase [Streptococcus]|uniref:GNAT family N-acetyltransferase n=1 Tax=Streptococcus caledonicus TaxID=2614158 RepID=A0ABW0UCJ8_9STRE|nr:GNAT family N-acetyltransferase [Streptococcus sp. S784/96/1]
MIKPVDSHSLSDWSALASTVWQTERLQLEKDFQIGSFPYEFLFWQNGRAVAFISLSIRKDYVEGAKTSPVAYLEGINVLSDYQRSGIAKELIDFARQWARNQGIRQLASNCELDNLTSQAFHSAVGFKEVSRTVNYVLDC